MKESAALDTIDVVGEHSGFLNYDRTPKEFGYPPRLVNPGDVLPINAPPIRRATPRETLDVEVLASQFSRRPHEDVTLHWLYSGIDTLGIVHTALERGCEKIAFRHLRVELARRIQITVPTDPMLCTLTVSAVTATGEVLTGNFVQHFVCKAPPPELEDRGHTLVLRRRVENWESAEWLGAISSRDEAARTGSSYGQGAGLFEWIFFDEAIRQLARACRIRVLVANHEKVKFVAVQPLVILMILLPPECLIGQRIGQWDILAPHS